jgi:hypothetical protein
MRARVELENIEAMRIEAGIHDIGLREDVCGLRAGDVVKLSARARNRPPPGEPLLVRVTSVAGGVLRGRLTHAASASQLAAGALLTFAPAHVHSVVSRGEAGGASGVSARRRAGRLVPVVAGAIRYTFAKREIG